MPKSANTHQRESQAGNVLFLILIAIALFAALSYAVTQSGRGGSKSAKDEKYLLAYAEIENHIAQTQVAMQRMVYSGTPLSNVDARWSDSDFANSNCTSVTCQLYHPSGGGLPLKPTRKNSASFGPAGAAYYTFAMDDKQMGVRSGLNWLNTPTLKQDAVLGMYTNRDFCAYFNAKNEITADPDTMTTTLGWNYPIGTTWADAVQSVGSSFGGGHIPQFANAKAGCFKVTSSGAYVILAVVWPQ